MRQGCQHDGYIRADSWRIRGLRNKGRRERRRTVIPHVLRLKNQTFSNQARLGASLVVTRIVDKGHHSREQAGLGVKSSSKSAGKHGGQNKGARTSGLLRVRADVQVQNTRGRDAGDGPIVMLFGQHLEGHTKQTTQQPRGQGAAE